MQHAETVRQCDEGHQEEEGAGEVTVHAPIVPSATVQTTVRQPLLMAGTPATTIAIAGSQYRRKTRHRLDRMSRDLQVVALDSTLLLRFQGYSKIWSAVQSQAKLRSNHGQLSEAIGPRGSLSRGRWRAGNQIPRAIKISVLRVPSRSAQGRIKRRKRRCAPVLAPKLSSL